MNTKSPCLNCNNRELICHDSCIRYSDFKVINEEIKEARATYSNSKWIYINSIARSKKYR